MSESAPQLEPTIIVIFGITGDLAQRKLLPALYHLIKDKLLHEETRIVGLSRKQLTTDELLGKIELCVLENDNVCDPTVMQEIRSKLRMVQLDPVKPEDYQALLQTLDDIEADAGMCMNRLYYLSIPPQVYGPVVRNLGENGLNKSCKHGNAKSRLLVEKPFGYDLESAKELIADTEQHFSEEQVLRIDHYLAKETAQNLLSFRRYNPAFSLGWSATEISEITVRAHEKIGVEGRANFYDQIGALRDLIQSHLLQLLALTTMELPQDIHDSTALHTAKEQLLESIDPADPTHAARAQYEGYDTEIENPGSPTETYAHLQLHIANQRWNNTKIILETGKAMREKRTDIFVTFSDDDAINLLTFRLQPNEGIDLSLTVKQPGFAERTQEVSMDFSYATTFPEPAHPDAYERVLVDAVRGDHTLFATGGEVLASWRILQPILDAWQNSDEPIRTYPAGWDGAGA